MVGLCVFLGLLNEPIQLLALLGKLAGGLSLGGLLNTFGLIPSILGIDLRIHITRVG
jgi:hypothetical protein